MDSLCIIAVVERGKADKIVEHAKTVGAKGATVFYGRGTGESEVKRFLNIHIESSKEIILVLSDNDKYKAIFDAMIEAGKLTEPGKGIIFTMPILNIAGINNNVKNVSQ